MAISSNHKHAPWRKSVLIPFWVVQLIFELVIIAALALSVAAVEYYDDNGYDFTNKSSFNM